MKKLRVVLWTLFSFGLFIIASCSLNPRDVQGLYMGVIHDLSDKTAEVVIQLYGDGHYAMRKTMYEDGSHPLFRQGNWIINDSKVILIADGEKDLRFTFEHGTLKLEASSTGMDSIPADQLKLLPLGK